LEGTGEEKKKERRREEKRRKEKKKEENENSKEKNSIQLSQPSHLDHAQDEKHVRRERLDGDGLDGRVGGKRVDSVFWWFCLMVFFFSRNKKKKGEKKNSQPCPSFLPLSFPPFNPLHPSLSHSHR